MYDWFLSPVEDKKRGDIQAKTSIVSLIGGTLFTFTASFAIDKFEAEGNMNVVFVILTVSIFVLALLQLTCLLTA